MFVANDTILLLHVLFQSFLLDDLSPTKSAKGSISTFTSSLFGLGFVAAAAVVVSVAATGIGGGRVENTSSAFESLVVKLLLLVPPLGARKRGDCFAPLMSSFPNCDSTSFLAAVCC